MTGRLVRELSSELVDYSRTDSEVRRIKKSHLLDRPTTCYHKRAVLFLRGVAKS